MKNILLLLWAFVVPWSAFSGEPGGEDRSGKALALKSKTFDAEIRTTSSGDRLCLLTTVQNPEDTLIYASFADTILSYSPRGSLRITTSKEASFPPFVESFFSGEDSSVFDMETSPLPSENLPTHLSTEYIREHFPSAFTPRLPRTALKDVHTANRVDLRSQACDAIVVCLSALDPQTPELMDRVRHEAGRLPIFWAFTDTKVEDILQIYPKPLPSETALSGASLPYPVGSVLLISEGAVRECPHLSADGQ